MSEVTYRVGGKVPTNVYRVNGPGHGGTYIGHLCRVEDAALVVAALNNALTAGEWHLLQAMLQDRIRDADAEGFDETTPSGQARRRLSAKLLHHELAARQLEHPGAGQLPEPLRSMTYRQRLQLTTDEWLQAWDPAPADGAQTGTDLSADAAFGDGESFGG